MGSFPPALFIITMCLRKKTCPLPRLFIVREYGGGGGGWIPVGPLKTDLSSIFYGIPFLPALSKMNKSCTAFVLLMFQLFMFDKISPLHTAIILHGILFSAVLFHYFVCRPYTLLFASSVLYTTQLYIYVQ
jgi:hypothetical protein